MAEPGDADDGRGGENRLRLEADRVRAANAIGKSHLLNALFDYLLERSIQGSQPKESEIAMDVFGKVATTDLGQDATVRVNVHRLRKKLQDYYLEPGRSGGERLNIPKGEYRLELVDPVSAEAPAAAPEPVPVAPPEARSRWRWALPVLALVALLLVGAYVVHRRSAEPDLRDMAPWNAVGVTSPRVILSVGDYPRRGEQPRHLPIGAAMSLNATLPLVASLVSPPRTLNVVPNSQLSPGMIVNSDIVYVGHLNTLGILRDIVFAQSRYTPGETYAELVDRRTGKRYRADPIGPDEEAMTRKDYCLILSFPGPKGGRLIVLAGTSDTAMIQASETAADPVALKALLAKLPATDRFEALYEVKTIGNRNVHADLIEASRLPEFSWDIQARQRNYPQP